MNIGSIRFVMHMKGLCCLRPILVFACLGISNRLTAQEAERVFRAWERREREIQSGWFEWTETRTIPKGGILAEDRQGNAIPSEDTTLAIKHRFSFDGVKFRHSEEGPAWNDFKNGFVIRKRIATWNGKEGKAYYPDFTEFPRAEVYPVNAETGDPSLRALIVTYRCLNKAWIDNNADPLASIRSGVIDGRSCLLLDLPFARPKDGLKRTFWVDPSRGLVPLRVSMVRNQDLLIEQMSIDFERDANWVYPSRWRTTLFHQTKDKPSRISIHKVTDHALNVDVPPEEFDNPFEEGTLVGYGFTPKPPPSYIVRANGEKRIVTRAEQERGATYEDLLRTESGLAGLPKPDLFIWFRRLSWVLIPLLTGLLIWRTLFSGRRTSNKER